MAQAFSTLSGIVNAEEVFLLTISNTPWNAVNPSNLDVIRTIECTIWFELRTRLPGILKGLIFPWPSTANNAFVPHLCCRCLHYSLCRPTPFSFDHGCVCCYWRKGLCKFQLNFNSWTAVKSQFTSSLGPYLPPSSVHRAFWHRSQSMGRWGGEPIGKRDKNPLGKYEKLLIIMTWPGMSCNSGTMGNGLMLCLVKWSTAHRCLRSVRTMAHRENAKEDHNWTD